MTSLTTPGDSSLKAIGGHNPLPKPLPAYLPVPGSKSPLAADRALYSAIQQAPRTLVQSFTLPPRSGRAWQAPSGSIVRISTPEGPQVGDLNIWNAHDPRERFWAARTRQLYRSHVSTYDRLWSCLPFMRPLCTIVWDGLEGYGRDEWGGRVHDLLGTRCDPYVNALLSSGCAREGVEAGGERREEGYDFHCHSNLVRAVLEWGLTEQDVHDVINLFQVTSLDEEGRYCMSSCPARRGDCIEVFAEVDLLMALSTCPGGDLSCWGFGSQSEEEMRNCCRPLKVEVFRPEDDGFLQREGWEGPKVAPYRGMHGIFVPRGEFEMTRLG